MKTLHLPSLLCWAALWFLVMQVPARALGTGITADVGLTPPVDRWIVRSQLRYMEMGNDPSPKNRSMQMWTVPVVLAYGLRPEWTVIVKQAVLHRELRTGGTNVRDTGLGDLRLTAKYRLLRINRPQYILGVAPTFSLELPTGTEGFGSDTWDAAAGLYASGRIGPLGADLNLEYDANGVGNREATRPGDGFTVNAAVAYQFTLNDEATLSVWPVLELLYRGEGRDRAGGQDTVDSGGDLLLLSPGIKLARQSFMLELLVQFPTHQNRHGVQPERGVGALAGIRYLF